MNGSLRFYQNPFKIRPMDHEKQEEDAFAQLEWLVEAGADEAIEEQAGMLHWQAGKATSMPKKEGISTEALEAALGQNVQPSAPKPLRRASSSSVVDVPPSSVKATSLSELRAEIEGFSGCGLKETAINLVFSDGNPEANIMIIGDAPVEDDDRQGKPFMGAHGALLDKMLAAIGLDRDTVYLTNLVFWRPPGGRSPTQEEVEACLPFVQQHIALVKPKMVICLGAAVARNILRNSDSFSKVRGKWFDYTAPLHDTETVPCLPTHPPSYLLRLPTSKRQAWQDLLKIKSKLQH